MIRRLGTLKWRWLALAGLVALALLGAGILRRLGLGEAALLLAVVSLVFLIESARFIWKQFAKGYASAGRAPFRNDPGD